MNGADDFPLWGDRETVRRRARDSRPPFGADPAERAALRPELAPQSRRFLERFGEPGTFLMFIAWPRSGHSLLGALLDAHPDMAIAHELHVFKWYSEEFASSEVMYACWQNARHYGIAGRLWGAYDYTVPGQWQGRVRRLSVLGDKKGGESSMVLSETPDNVDRVQRRLRPRIRMVHAVRHPLDNIATMAQRSRTTQGQGDGFGRALQRYLRCAEANRQTCALYPDDTITVWHEDLIADPRRELRRLAAYLGVEADPAWIEACAGIVRPSASRSRDRIDWTSGRLAAVRDIVGRFDFLQRYDV